MVILKLSPLEIADISGGLLYLGKGENIMEWITTANGIIALITGLIGLIGSGVGAFFAIKNWVKLVKEKSAHEIWTLITEIADASMKEAERAAKEGLITKEAKKQMVIDSVKAGCKAAGINLDGFIDQLSDYIDETISFVNSMKK